MNLSFVCLALALLVSVSQPSALAADKLAVLVGITKYSHSAMNENELKFPEADAKSVADTLKKNGYSVKLLLGSAATREAVVEALNEVATGGTSDGVSLLGFFGHGVQYGSDAYFCAYDTKMRIVMDSQGNKIRDAVGKLKLEPDPAYMVAMKEILDCLTLCGSGNKILLADCCREDPNAARGRAFGSKLALSDLPQRTAALFACSANERAFEHDDWRHGAFTKAFLDECQSSGELTANKLSDSLYRRVQSLVNDKTSGLSKQTVHGLVNGFVDLQLTSVSRTTMRVTIPRPNQLSAPFTKSEALSKQQAWSNYLKQPVTYRNTLGTELQLIPAGSFVMGSNESSRRPDEEPHTVVLTKPVYIAKHETTVGEFAQFVSASGYKTHLEKYDDGSNRGWDSSRGQFRSKVGYSWKNPGWKQANDHPVVNVTWSDANAFTKWLSVKEGRRYRLLTEAEWEYCCRAGTTSTYSVGNSPDGLTRVGNVLDRTGLNRFRTDYQLIERSSSDAIRGDDGADFTAPVGSYLPNNFGLYDFHGNVCEWCNDWYDEKYGLSRSNDPQGGLQAEERCARGGRFDTGKFLAKSFTRNHGPIYMSDMILGFRIALELED